jgi:hypothetical protein
MQISLIQFENGKGATGFFLPHQHSQPHPKSIPFSRLPHINFIANEGIQINALVSLITQGKV